MPGKIYRRVISSGLIQISRYLNRQGARLLADSRKACTMSAHCEIRVNGQLVITYDQSTSELAHLAACSSWYFSRFLGWAYNTPPIGCPEKEIDWWLK